MSLSDLFSNAALVKVLSQFFLHPDTPLYQAKLVEETGFALIQVQRALSRLGKTGLIFKSPEGNRVYYTANRTHPAFEDLKRAFFKTIILGDFLKAALHSLKNKIFFAFIYGSFARAEEGKESDLDLFVIGNLTTYEISSLLGPFNREANLEVNPVIYSADEYKKRWKLHDHFIRQTLENPKIWLIGEENELRKMVEGRKAAATLHLVQKSVNKKTEKALKMSERGKGIKKFNSLEELFINLGM